MADDIRRPDCAYRDGGVDCTVSRPRQTPRRSIRPGQHVCPASQSERSKLAAESLPLALEFDNDDRQTFLLDWRELNTQWHEQNSVREAREHARQVLREVTETVDLDVDQSPMKGLVYRPVSEEAHDALRRKVALAAERLFGELRGARGRTRH